MKIALLVIDLQKEYYAGLSKESMDSAAEYINASIPLFRRAGLPVVWIQDIDEEEGVVPGSVGFDFIDSLRPEEEDHRIHKQYGNAFNKTNLLQTLKDKDIDTVLVTGYCAENCVLSTYRGALDHDIVPIILKNGIASGNPDNKGFVENISNIITYAVLRKLLEQDRDD